MEYAQNLAKHLAYYFVGGPNFYYIINKHQPEICPSLESVKLHAFDECGGLTQKQGLLYIDGPVTMPAAGDHD